jgi:hypothetical protein
MERLTEGDLLLCSWSVEGNIEMSSSQQRATHAVLFRLFKLLENRQSSDERGAVECNGTGWSGDELEPLRASSHASLTTLSCP